MEHSDVEKKKKSLQRLSEKLICTVDEKNQELPPLVYDDSKPYLASEGNITDRKKNNNIEAKLECRIVSIHHFSYF